METKFHAVNIVLGAVGALIAAVVLATGLFAGPGTGSSLRVHEMVADYPVYLSMGNMVSRSSTVIRGTVTKVLPSYRVIPGEVPLDQLPAEKAASVGFMQTDVQVRVDKVYSGPENLLNSTVTVINMGGEDSQNRYVASEGPISAQDRSYVFFLAGADNGRYVIVGGGQGRYLIEDNKLITLSKERLPMNDLLQGMNTSKFDRDFRSLAKAPPMQPRTPDLAEPASEPLVDGGVPPKVDDGAPPKK